MDNVIKDLILFLETEIVSINNIISKINVASSLEKIGSLFDEESIWDLTIDNVEKLKRNLHGDNKLSHEEESFLYSFVDMPLEVKELKKNLFGLGTEHKKVLQSINHKINNENEFVSDMKDLKELEKVLEENKSLLGKLRNNTVSLITEIDLVTNLLDKNNISLEKQIETFMAINAINAKVFENYGIQGFAVDNDDEVLSEKDLVETNMNQNDLQELFERFGIKWEVKPEEYNTEKKKINRQKKIDKFWQKLLKYGDYKKMENLLQFIVDNKLEFVFEELEILTKTLLFSSVEKLTDIKKKSNQNGINFQKILMKQPTLFYPSVRELNKAVKVGTVSSGDNNLTGALNYYMSTVDFFRRMGYPVAEIFEHCSSVCRIKTKTIQKVHDALTSLYGISFWKPNGEVRKGFNALSTLRALDNLDIGIESGEKCYSWFQDNLSKLLGYNLNLYMVKLAKSRGISEKDIFIEYNSKKHELALKTIYSSGQDKSETFKLYGAIEPEFELKDVYESIIKNSDNDTISNIALKDSMIEQLDVLYKPRDNDFIYEFDGVIISRLKVLRNYQTLISSSNIVPSKDVLLYSIVRLSMLNQEEYDKIRECMKQVKFKGRG